MRFYPLLFFITCFFPLLPAQELPQNLKEQSSILWGSLSFTDYPLDLMENGESWKTLKKYQLNDQQRPSGNLFKKQLLHFQSPSDSDFLIAESMNFSNRLFEDIISATVPIFKTPSCQKQLNEAERKEVLYFKGELAASKKVTYTARHLQSLEVVWRLCHWVYYDQKTKQFLSQPIAIAPLAQSKNDDGSYSLGEPLFWLPVKTTTSPQAFLHFQTVRGLHLADASKHWGTKDYSSTSEDFFTHLEEIQQPFWESKNYKNYQKQRATDLEQGLSSTDTLETFDPKTFEKIVHVKSYDCMDNPVECFPGIALQHRWSWDGQQLWVRQAAWGFQRRLAVGEITYPYFWQTVEEK